MKPLATVLALLAFLAGLAVFFWTNNRASGPEPGEAAAASTTAVASAAGDEAPPPPDYAAKLATFTGHGEIENTGPGRSTR